MGTGRSTQHPWLKNINHELTGTVEQATGPNFLVTENIAEHWTRACVDVSLMKLADGDHGAPSTYKFALGIERGWRGVLELLGVREGRLRRVRSQIWRTVGQEKCQETVEPDWD